MKKLLFLSLLFVFNSFNKVEAQVKFPFTKVDFENGLPLVNYKDTMVSLLAIDGVSIIPYLEEVKKRYPVEWQEDFIKKMPYMYEMLADSSVNSVQVKLLVDGSEITHQYTLAQNHFMKSIDYLFESISKNSIKRDHSSFQTKSYAYLKTRRYDEPGEDALTKKEVMEDLEHLEWQIEHNYSYKDLRNFDYRTAIDVLISGVENGIHPKDFSSQLKMLMANFGDGHSDLSFYTNVFDRRDEEGKLPFRIIKHDHKYFAVYYDDELLATHSSELHAIENIEINDIYLMAEKLVSKTTPGFVENKSLLYMQEMKLMLSFFNVKVEDKAQVTFVKDGSLVTEEFQLGTYQYPSPIKRDSFSIALHRNNIGVIRMTKFMAKQDYDLEKIEKAMSQFKDTDGLIIDIRRNSGGYREPLEKFLGYFIQEPKVCNVAKYRINEAIDFKPVDGYLEQRDLYYENSEAFNLNESKQVKDFIDTFKPLYEVRDEAFSDFHYYVVSPGKEEWYYDKPVVVLVDSYCFSASDIFAAGMKLGDKVVLMGETTGGGSGFTKGFILPNSKIKMSLSSMVSYQVDGNLYDGHGVIPDIELVYTKADMMGSTDSFYEKAIKYLVSKK